MRPTLCGDGGAAIMERTFQKSFLTEAKSTKCDITNYNTPDITVFSKNGDRYKEELVGNADYRFNYYRMTFPPLLRCCDDNYCTNLTSTKKKH